MALSRDGKLIAGAGKKQVIIWDVVTGQVWQTLPEHRTEVGSVAFAPDGKTLLTATLQPFVESDLQLWDVETGKLRGALTGANAAVYAATFSPDGKTLASGGQGKDVRLWNNATGEVKYTLPAGNQSMPLVGFSPDGKIVFSPDEDNSLHFWNQADGRLLMIMLFRSDDYIAYTPDGYYDAPPDAEALIRWRVGGQLFPVEWYRNEFRRPGLVGKILSGVTK